jgi:Na+/melibiose symporter-like transporter
VKIKNFLSISWKKIVVVLALWLISVILHNLISGLLGNEEAFFFIVAVFVLPIYLVVALLYSLLRKK